MPSISPVQIQKQPLKLLYLIASDEVLLRNQARDQVRELARQAGFLQHTTVQAEGFDQLWDQLNTQDLFSDKLFVQVIYPSEKNKQKMDNYFIEQLIHYSKNPNPSKLLLILMPKLSSTQQKSNWFKVIETHGHCIVIRSLYKNEWPAWLQMQAKQLQLCLSPQAINTLQSLTEGNLLAAYQALEKLRLLRPSHSTNHDLIHAEQVLEAACDQSRQSVFDLSEAVLSGHTALALRHLKNLKNTGTEAIFVLWSLAKDCRDLGELRCAKANGERLDTLIQKHWQSRANLLKTACRQLKYENIESGLLMAQKVDEAIKGRRPEDPWILLEKLIFILTGHSELQ